MKLKQIKTEELRRILAETIRMAGEDCAAVRVLRRELTRREGKAVPDVR